MMRLTHKVHVESSSINCHYFSFLRWRGWLKQYSLEVSKVLYQEWHYLDGLRQSIIFLKARFLDLSEILWYGCPEMGIRFIAPLFAPSYRWIATKCFSDRGEKDYVKGLKSLLSIEDESQSNGAVIRFEKSWIFSILGCRLRFKLKVLCDLQFAPTVHLTKSKFSRD